ncbi:MAG: septum formation protein Maf [Clostridia bacterium]|nr:septum formation protein Maf [Clostridia bacterium]
MRMKFNRRIVLASSSPRRREILEKLGIAFDIIPSNADEGGVTGSADETVMILAARKAKSVAEKLSDALVIGCDTLVALENDVFGKPESTAQAEEMLSRLSGNTHRVLSGLCLIDTATGETRVSREETFVSFKALSPEEIRAYVLSGEPMDKAGAYAIQGGAGKFVSEVKGSYDNIVGFPSELFLREVRQMGILED